MKTYSIICAFLALVVIGCSTSNETDSTVEISTFYKNNYTILMENSGTLTSQELIIDGEGISLDALGELIATTPLPSVALQKKLVYAHYKALDACNGAVSIHDIGKNTEITVHVFQDLNSCELEVTALELQGMTLYVSYVKKENAKSDMYFVRVIDLEPTEPMVVTDVALTMKPLQMAYVNMRLFILGIDLEITNENTLFVMDVNSNALINDIGLGYDAHQILVNEKKELVISYEELHTLMNSTTYAVTYIQYETGKEPSFHDSRFNDMDSRGRLFFKRTVEDGNHPSIPAIYDFEKNLATLYYYENFLTESQLDVEYRIGDTSVVAYDAANNMLIVGYIKKDNGNKGGILRIQLDSDPEPIDNTDLEGVPTHIFHR